MRTEPIRLKNFKAFCDVYPRDPRITPRLIVAEGKRDLALRMVGKLRGCLNPAARFVVLRDQE